MWHNLCIYLNLFMYLFFIASLTLFIYSFSNWHPTYLLLDGSKNISFLLSQLVDFYYSASIDYVWNAPTTGGPGLRTTMVTTFTSRVLWLVSNLQTPQFRASTHKNECCQTQLFVTVFDISYVVCDSFVWVKSLRICGLHERFCSQHIFFIPAVTDFL